MNLEGTHADAPELDPTPANQADQPSPEPADEPIDLDAPADEPVDLDAQPPAEGEETAPEGENPEDPESGMVDVEIDGKTYKLPPELKDSFLRHADYTRKTQETAEIKRSYEAKFAEAERNLSMSNEVIEARAALLNVNQQLAQYQNVDWQRLEAEDPFSAQSHWRQFQQLREAHGNIAGFLDQKQKEWTDQGEQATAKRLQETAEFARKEIPGWSPDVDAKVTDFAVSTLGFTPDTLRSAYNPQVYRALHLAWIGHQTLTKQQAAPRQPAPPTKPIRSISSSSNTRPEKDYADMSMDEYVKAVEAKTSKAKR